MVVPPIRRSKRQSKAIWGIGELVGEPAAALELQLADGAFVDHALHQRDRRQGGDS